MHSLPSSSGQNEPKPPKPFELHPEDKAANLFTWAVLGIVVYYSYRRTFAEEEVQLAVLHGITKGLQKLALHIGHWGLKAEHNYNRTVENLH